MKIIYNQAYFPISSLEEMKYKVLNWVNRFSIFSFLDNNQYPPSSQDLEVLAAAEPVRVFESTPGQALSGFQQTLDQYPGWWFGHLGYDLKNETEPGLQSRSEDPIGFPDLFFFQPRHILRLRDKGLEVWTLDDPTDIFKAICQQPVPKEGAGIKVEVQSRLSRSEYIRTIEALKAHILRGDCYEINYCQEFFGYAPGLDPGQVYQSLSRLSPNPFSAYYRLQDRYLLCASPERYLRKTGQTVISQPIKGTMPRYPRDPERDRESRARLEASQKDRAENVMVVDLVRNDLSRFCEESSVEVEELFGIYAFPQVFQMISTVRGTLPANLPFADIIRASFPMGSMTGAPKRRVMELIEQYEKSKRGLFSGAVGYIQPNGDFDFNVVIRSLFYNASNHYLSFSVGSGITYYCQPELEYEECLMKAEAILKIIGD